MSVEINGKKFKTKMAKLPWSMDEKGKFLSLNLKKKEITDITQIKGLESLNDLETLNLNDNKLTKITGLDKLTNLKHLIINNNDLLEISGLENLENLEILNLSLNKIKEIEGLNNLKKLRKLDLGYNKIEKIKNLERLEDLIELNLANNQIIEINGLENLKNLTTIQLDGNNINTFKGFGNLSNLRNLMIKKNPITNFIEDLFEITSMGYVRNVKLLVAFSAEVDKTHRELTEIDGDRSLPSTTVKKTTDFENTLISYLYAERNIIELINQIFTDNDEDVESEIIQALVNLGVDALALITVLIKYQFIMRGPGEELSIEFIKPLIRVIGDMKNPKSKKTLLEIEKKIDGYLLILDATGPNDNLKHAKDLVTQALRKVSEPE